MVVAALQVRDQVLDQDLRVLPALGAEAAAAVHEDDKVHLRLALQELAMGRGLVELGAGHLVALPELEARLARGFVALARANRRLLDGLVTALGAAPTGLGASAPVSPVVELAILVAVLGVAALGLLGVVARLAPVLHFPMHRPHALADAAAALGGAAGPALPLVDDAVHGAGVRVATLRHLEGRALHAAIRLHKDGARVHEYAAATGLGADAGGPIGDLAVGHVDDRACQFLEFAADLLQGAGLGPRVVLVVAASFHLHGVVAGNLVVLRGLQVRRGLGLDLVRGGLGEGRLGLAEVAAEVRELGLVVVLLRHARGLQRRQLALQLTKLVLDAGLDDEEAVLKPLAIGCAESALRRGHAVDGRNLCRDVRNVHCCRSCHNGRSGSARVRCVRHRAKAAALQDGQRPVALALGEADLVVNGLLCQHDRRVPRVHGLVIGAQEVLLHVALGRGGLQLVEEGLQLVVLHLHEVAGGPLSAVGTLHQEEACFACGQRQD
mmetsp:Transcript_78956/g.256032  ORF Transcript_78956/g.256032 Transcript_78956/m.256032 type:complete len:496 (-) Transcript_78956:719-2206(-)